MFYAIILGVGLVLHKLPFHQDFKDTVPRGDAIRIKRLHPSVTCHSNKINEKTNAL